MYRRLFYSNNGGHWQHGNFDGECDEKSWDMVYSVLKFQTNPYADRSTAKPQCHVLPRFGPVLWSLAMLDPYIHNPTSLCIYT